MADARSEVVPVLAMGGLFLVSIALAVAIAPTFAAEDLQAFEDPENLWNPIIYLGIVVAFTLVILVIARMKLQRLIQYIILGATFLTMVYVFWPLLGLVMEDSFALTLGTAAAVALTAALYYYPEWWIVDSVGVVVSAGAAAIFGISFGLLPSLALLVAFAVYDAIAVYRTKHMLDLADSVLELRLPIMFVVPRTRGYSFLKEKGLKARAAEGEGAVREAMFMGLGDVVIPCILVVSALHFLNADGVAAVGPLGGPALVALATVLGTLVGYAVLMAFVLRGNPQAGLPSLNGGAIVGFFAALLPLYGVAPLLDSLCAFVGC
ncbi:MAG TPA: presenilin family intramembrane aspartyl protease PSH [Candidatus Thermoplasmatota archaeon]|nr:presenilin family intramembrane aspartyl protease PSH [Candidatus Thermoplasmatota archaeon]